MSAWGAGSSSSSGGFKSCNSLLQRLETNDPKLTEIVILPMKDFKDNDVERLATCIQSGTNTNLKTISASGHAITPDSLNKLGRALASSSSNITHLAIGDQTMGDDGIKAFCEGLSTASAGSDTTTDENAADNDTASPCKLEFIDLSYKGL